MVSLPMDMLMKNQVSQENVLRGLDNENMRSITFEMASQANSHLQKVRCLLLFKLILYIIIINFLTWFNNWGMWINKYK